MKLVKFRCKKCGYELIIPEKTESVLCGNCATWNKTRGLFAGIDQEASNGEGSILQKIPGSIYSDFPERADSLEKKEELPADAGERVNPGPFSMVALIFILAPLISFIVAKLELPPFVAFIVLAVIIILYQFAKKKS